MQMSLKSPSGPTEISRLFAPLEFGHLCAHTLLHVPDKASEPGLKVGLVKVRERTRAVRGHLVPMGQPRPWLYS